MSPGSNNSNHNLGGQLHVQPESHVKQNPNNVCAGMAVSQVNGQRMIGPPDDWEGPPPPKGCEVYVKRIPRFCSEQDLFPVFASVGKIYVLRLMLDFSGTCRGFCFVQYATPALAKKAINELDGREIRPNQRIRVSLSVDNCRLFLGHIPKTLTRQQIFDVLKAFGSELEDVILYLSPSDKSLNRGFCFAQYESHRAAAIARRFLVFQASDLFGSEDVKVDWAVPEIEISEDLLKTLTIIYLRNLLLRTSENTIKAAVSQCVDPVHITRLRKVRDFAFVHFDSREHAEIALNALDGITIDGAEIKAVWARPPQLQKRKEPKVIRNDASRVPTLVGQDAERPRSPGGRCNKYLTAPNQNLNQCIASPMPFYANGGPNILVPYRNHPMPSPSQAPHQPFMDNNSLFMDIHSLVNFYTLNYRPSEALRQILLNLNWGRVSFEIIPQPSTSRASSCMYVAVLTIEKDERVLGFPELATPPAPDVEQAKDNTALSFISTILLKG